MFEKGSLLSHWESVAWGAVFTVLILWFMAMLFSQILNIHLDLIKKIFGITTPRPQVGTSNSSWNVLSPFFFESSDGRNKATQAFGVAFILTFTTLVFANLTRNGMTSGFSAYIWVTSLVGIIWATTRWLIWTEPYSIIPSSVFFILTFAAWCFIF